MDNGRQSISMMPWILIRPFPANGTGITLNAMSDNHSIPVLTTRRVGRGGCSPQSAHLFGQDFRDTGEWLLAPPALGLQEFARVDRDQPST